MTDADEKVPEPEEDAEEPAAGSAEAEEQNKDDSAVGQDEKTEEDKDEKEKKNKDKPKEPLELSIELIDGAGVRVRLPLEHFMPVPPVTKSRFLRTGKESGRMGRAYEPTLQTYRLPLQSFMDANPDFDPQQLRSLRFVFDRGREGVLIIDRIGIARKGPAPDLN